MKIFSRGNALSAVVAFAVTLTIQTTADAPAAELPNPVLVFLGQEYVDIGGKKMTRYYFEVFNKDEYPAELFAAAPALPPCGRNTNASRTWIDMYDQSGKRLNGFCSLGGPSQLNRIWFALDQNELPPRR